MKSPIHLHRARPWTIWVGAISTVVLATGAMYAARDGLHQAHVALVYLLIVLAGSAYGGRLVGKILAVLGFLSIDYFFQAPFDRLSVGNSLDWFVLVSFVITATVAADLLARAQAAAGRAQRRTEEVARLSRLGAELLGAGTAETALGAIAERVRQATKADACAVYRIAPGDATRLELLLSRGDGRAIGADDAWPAVERDATLTRAADGAWKDRPEDSSADSEGALSESAPAANGTRALIVPLRVHERTVGVLGVSSVDPLSLEPPTRRLLDALTYYCALGVERVNLLAELEHTEALREGVRVREALLTSVSHDLRTPLATIKVLAQDTMTRQSIDIAMTNASVIEEQADRLTRLVNNLLDVTRLRSSAIPLHIEVNAAEDLVGAVARQVEGILGDHPLQRRISSEDPVLLGTFDFVQSQRILVNLIENAVRYSPPTAPIVLSAWRDGDGLLFSVADSGCGIDETHRVHVFEPFYRGEAEVADVTGIGLGLHIARALAEAQGGRLDFTPGVVAGSVFTLTLRAAVAASADTDGDLNDDAAEVVEPGPVA